MFLNEVNNVVPVGSKLLDKYLLTGLSYELGIAGLAYLNVDLKEKHSANPTKAMSVKLIKGDIIDMKHTLSPLHPYIILLLLSVSVI